MITGTDIYRRKLSDNRLLVLRKGKGWEDIYLNTLVLPMLNGKLPEGVEPAASSENARCWRVTSERGSLFVKFFSARGLKDSLPFRKTRSLRAMEGGEILLKNGFSTPMFIAQGELLRGLKTLENFIITRWLDGSLNTYHLLRSLFDPPLDRETLLRKRIFIKTLGQLIGRLHRKGIYHGDLRPGNILIGVLDDDFHFNFIDNERTRYFPEGIPLRLREKNLVQINMIVKPRITFTDRLRFFEAYLSENPEFLTDAKGLALKIASKTGERLFEKLPDIPKTFRNKKPLGHL